MRRKECGILLISAIMLAACGAETKHSGVKRWESFPVPIYLDQSLTESSPSARSDFEDALAFWESRAGKQLFDFRGIWTGGDPYTGSLTSPSSISANVMFLQTPWQQESSIAGQTVLLSQRNSIKGAVIVINPSITYCYWSCPSEKKVFTHEVGHFLGLPHSGDTNDIMYPEVQSDGAFMDMSHDAAALAQLVN